MVMNNVSKDHTIFREPEIVDGEKYKSDLVIKKL